MSKMVECGFYRLAADKTFHNASYECAAWWKDTLVKAGDYPVRAEIESGSIRYFHVALPGLTTEDYFQSLFCGNRIGSAYDTKQNAGEPSSYHIQSYSYNVFSSMKDADSPWHIDVSLLPNVALCSVGCGEYTSVYPGPRGGMCVHCRVAEDHRELERINRRYPRFIKAVKNIRQHWRQQPQIEHPSIIDNTILSYLRERSQEENGYYCRAMSTVFAVLKMNRAERNICVS